MERLSTLKSSEIDQAVAQKGLAWFILISPSDGTINTSVSIPGVWTNARDAPQIVGPFKTKEALLDWASTYGRHGKIFLGELPDLTPAQMKKVGSSLLSTFRNLWES